MKKGLLVEQRVENSKASLEMQRKNSFEITDFLFDNKLYSYLIGIFLIDL
jgi:hypothetical protein